MDDLDQIISKGGSPRSSLSVSIRGTLTRDLDLRYLPNGLAACDFGIEFQDPKWDPHPYTLMQGIREEHVLCKAYDQMAKIANNYYRKGDQIEITGFIWSKKRTLSVPQVILPDAPKVVFEKLIVYVQEIILSEIQQVCHERGINTLCHFTRSERLRSILHRGLLNRNFLEKLPSSIRPQFPDLDRDDGYKDALCLSISFPNYRMFFSKTGRVNQHQWVVLLLDARILWELDCAFCHQNARFEPVLQVPLENRKRLVSLERMFWDSDYHSTGLRYQRQQIPNNYPTHPEAEVLVFDTIPAANISEIHFYNDNALQKWLKGNPGTYSQKFYANQKYFKPRSDYKVWQNR